jgi:hypothetical protein
VTAACEGPVCITCSDQGETATVLVTDAIARLGPASTTTREVTA